MLCTLSYGVMGLVVSIFFGPDIPSSSNLAWANYQGAGGGAAAQVPRHSLAPQQQQKQGWHTA